MSFGSYECDDPELPGVYTRVQAPAIRGWLASAFDADAANDPKPKPGPASGAPVISGTPVEGETLTCAKGTFAFGDHGLPAATTYEVRRLYEDGE